MAIATPCELDDQGQPLPLSQGSKTQSVTRLSVLDATAAVNQLQLPVLLGAVAQRLLLTGTRSSRRIAKPRLYTLLSHACTHPL